MLRVALTSVPSVVVTSMGRPVTVTTSASISSGCWRHSEVTGGSVTVLVGIWRSCICRVWKICYYTTLFKTLNHDQTKSPCKDYYVIYQYKKRHATGLNNDGQTIHETNNLWTHYTILWSCKCQRSKSSEQVYVLKSMLYNDVLLWSTRQNRLRTTTKNFLSIPATSDVEGTWRWRSSVAKTLGHPVGIAS